MVFFQNEKLGLNDEFHHFQPKNPAISKRSFPKLPRAEITSFPIIENNVISNGIKSIWHFDEKSMYRWSSPMRTFVHFIHPFPLKGQIPDAILTKPRRFQRVVRSSPFYFFGFMCTNPHFVLNAEAQNERLRKSPNLRVLRQKNNRLGDVSLEWNRWVWVHPTWMSREGSPGTKGQGLVGYLQ